MPTDRQRAEALFFPTMFLNLLYCGVRDDARDAGFEACRDSLVEANKEVLHGLDDRRYRQIQRRVVRLHDLVTEDARKAGARVDKIALVTLFCLQSVLECGYLELTEGTRLAAAIMAIQEAIGDAFEEARLVASAKKQAAKMLSLLQREGLFVGVTMARNAA